VTEKTTQPLGFTYIGLLHVSEEKPLAALDIVSGFLAVVKNVYDKPM
jgi:hypothetical protein